MARRRVAATQRDQAQPRTPRRPCADTSAADPADPPSAASNPTSTKRFFTRSTRRRLMRKTFASAAPVERRSLNAPSSQLSKTKALITFCGGARPCASSPPAPPAPTAPTSPYIASSPDPRRVPSTAMNLSRIIRHIMYDVTLALLRSDSPTSPFSVLRPGSPTIVSSHTPASQLQVHFDPFLASRRDRLRRLFG